MGMSINAQSYDDLHPGAGRESGEGTEPSSSADSSPAAARLLAITARETDQWREEARSEAAAVVAGAREEAAEIVRAAREEAERLVSSAREQAAQTVNDARVEAYRVREETTAVRKRHDEEVAALQHLANDHRARLRQHLTDLLERVDATPGSDQ
jgi:cell division septum initiation protein DivIVA